MACIERWEMERGGRWMDWKNSRAGSLTQRLTNCEVIGGEH